MPRAIATPLAIMALLVTGLPATPAAAATDSYARSLCRDRLSRDYGASASNVTAYEQGRDRYRVSGNASRRGETGRFDCTVDGGRVVALDASDWRKSDNGKTAAIAVGGAIALAAIIAAASSKKRSHEYDRYERQDYDRYDDRYYDDSYSPARDVTCYRNQRACYNSWNNSYNARWTNREFGY